MAVEFEIVTINFGPDQLLIEDLVDLISAGIADAGHVVRSSIGRFSKDRYHLFIDRIQPEVLDFLIRNKLPYGLLVTEEISEDGKFGWSHLEHGGSPYAQGEIYKRQVENADFVWCFLDASVPFCRRLNRRVGAIPFGFSERLLPKTPVPWHLRDVQIFAFGPNTPRREGVYDSLRKNGFTVEHPGHPVPAWVRNAYLARSRIFCAPARTENHFGFVNPQRVVQCAIFKVPLFIELESPEKHPLARYCVTTEPGRLAETLGGIDPGSEELEKIGNFCFEALAAERQMGPSFRALIESTVLA